jgi:hypothetical protein
MILRRNQDLFNTIKALAGVNDFTDNEITDLVSFTNRRLTMAYNTSPMWERYVVISEERNVSSFALSGLSDASYNAAYTKYGKYESTSGVFTDFYVPNNSTAIGSNFQFIRNSSGKWVWGTSAYQKDPVTNIVTLTGSGSSFATQQDDEVYDSPLEVKNWGSLSFVSGFLKLTAKQIVTYDEAFEELTSGATRVAKDTIQDFIRIHRNQSFLNNSATEYDFYVDVNGANVLNSSATDGKVFVTYKKKLLLPVPTGTESDSILEFSAHGTYADFLRMDGQHDKAAFEEQKADMFLATELERIDIINNNNSLNHKFTTYVNTSSR